MYVSKILILNELHVMMILYLTWTTICVRMWPLIYILENLLIINKNTDRSKNSFSETTYKFTAKKGKLQKKLKCMYTKGSFNE